MDVTIEYGIAEEGDPYVNMAEARRDEYDAKDSSDEKVRTWVGI